MDRTLTVWGIDNKLLKNKCGSVHCFSLSFNIAFNIRASICGKAWSVQGV